MSVVCDSGRRAPLAAFSAHIFFCSLNPRPLRYTTTTAAAPARRAASHHRQQNNQGAGLRVLMREGARRGMWPRAFAESHTFTSDPVIVDPDVTEGEAFIKERGCSVVRWNPLLRLLSLGLLAAAACLPLAWLPLAWIAASPSHPQRIYANPSKQNNKTKQQTKHTSPL